jgi:3,4-dihydroxy 2-butanone 4-phosphate synthase/GTP cyclohydrolase II
MLQSLTRGSDVNVDSPDLHTKSNHPHLLREFGVGGQILRNLGLSKLRLLTNSNTALPGLEAFGLEIAERIAP